MQRPFPCFAPIRPSTLFPLKMDSPGTSSRQRINLIRAGHRLPIEFDLRAGKDRILSLLPFEAINDGTPFFGSTSLRGHS